MKTTFKMGASTAIAALFALGAMHASAEDRADHGYAGVAIGNAKIDLDPATVSFSEWDTSWKVFGGYMFNENIGAEVTYQDLGSPDSRELAVDEMTSFATQVIGVLPLGNFDLFAKVGLAYYDAEIELANGGTPTRNGIELAGGFGARYNWGDFGVRAEAEAIDVDFGDVYNVSLGAEYRF